MSYKFTEFKADPEIADEIATDYANEEMHTMPTTLDREYASQLRDGLQAIADGSRLRAAVEFTRRSTAARLLEEIQIEPLPRDR